jgi:7-cyano-7-deazaguanine synthase
MTSFAPPVAVLCSGGLDSAVLLVEMARGAGDAIPVFVWAGHVWEPVERAALDRFVAAVGDPRIRPVRELSVPMHDVFGPRWPMTGEGFPDWDAPDQANEIRGRNLVLLAKTLVVAAVESWPTVVLASLRGNPFPDATESFLGKLAVAAAEGLAAPPLTIAAPYRSLTKPDVIRRGAPLPLHLTMSCARPTAGGRHCGACNKCRERREAFAAAGLEDRTSYEGRPAS